MIILMTLVCLSTRLSGLSNTANLYVLPETGLICGFEPRQNELSFFDLDGVFKQKMTVKGMVVKVCEASGLVFISTVKEGANLDLLVIHPNLAQIRHAKGITVYSPSRIQGKFYAMDVAAIRAGTAKYPRLAREFNLDSLSYGKEAILKIPEFLRREQFAFPEYWTYDVGKDTLVIFQSSFNILLLTSSYLLQERIESDAAEMHAPLIPLKLDQEIKNPGTYKISKVMLAEVLRKEIAEWNRKKTWIYTSWRLNNDIYIAYGELDSGKTRIAYINQLYQLIPFIEVDGQVRGGKGKELWSTIQIHEGITLNRVQFQP